MKSKQPASADKFAKKAKPPAAAEKVAIPYGKRYRKRTVASVAALAANLRRIRKERELSQADLARASGLDQAVIGHIEVQRTNPTLRILDKIAHGLGVTPADLLTVAKGRSTPKR